MKQQVLAAQVQNSALAQNGEADDDDEEETAAQAMSEFLAHEREIWRSFKATKYYDNLCMHKKHGAPLPFRDWLRLLLHVDTSLSINELVRIFEEEDSIVAMSSVRSFCRCMCWNLQHVQNRCMLLIFATSGLHTCV